MTPRGPERRWRRRCECQSFYTSSSTLNRPWAFARDRVAENSGLNRANMKWALLGFSSPLPYLSDRQRLSRINILPYAAGKAITVIDEDNERGPRKLRHTSYLPEHRLV